MVHVSLLAVLGLFGVASAVPAASNPVPDNVAAIMAKDPSTFTSYQTGGLIRGKPTENTTGVSARDCALGVNANGDCCATSSQFTWGDGDGGGWGITIQNGDPNNYMGFYFYENSCDYVPYKYVWIAGGATVFITLPWNFQGRMTRGTDAMNLNGSPNLLGTWFEFNWQSDGIWGDVSLIRGCDQGILIWSTDGSGAWKGFTQDILADAPVGAWAQKPDGNWCLAPTEGPTADQITLNYELGAVGAGNAYIDDAHGNPVINSANGRFGVYADPGLI